VTFGWWSPVRPPTETSFNLPIEPPLQVFLLVTMLQLVKFGF